MGQCSWCGKDIVEGIICRCEAFAAEIDILDFSKDPQHFGKLWRYMEDGSLVHGATGYWMDIKTGYWMDIQSAKSSAEVLDWIFQVVEKRWATSEVMYELLLWIRVLVNPQQGVCSFGREVAKKGR